MAGLKPNDFFWIIEGKLAGSECMGGGGLTARKIRSEEEIQWLKSQGINKSQIAVDPGLGFGKKMDDSKELFLNLNNLIKTYPVVVGYSRKKFTDQIKMTSSEMKEHCLHSGVDLVRLHLDN